MSAPAAPPAQADQTNDGDSLDHERPQLGHLAQWSVSSHKYGFGVENLRDGNEFTFWQSEGPQPHTIDLSFPKRVFIAAVAVLTSHPRDDSYTPSKICIKAGTGVHDLQDVRVVEFETPDGWMHIPLRPMGSNEEETIEGPAIPTHHLRIVIQANHLNGKDTHVRGVRVFGTPGTSIKTVLADVSDAASTTPSKDLANGRRLLEVGHDGLSEYTSQRFKMHEFIR